MISVVVPRECCAATFLNQRHLCIYMYLSSTTSKCQVESEKEISFSRASSVIAPRIIIPQVRSNILGMHNLNDFYLGRGVANKSTAARGDFGSACKCQASLVLKVQKLSILATLTSQTLNTWESRQLCILVSYWKAVLNGNVC